MTPKLSITEIEEIFISRNTYANIITRIDRSRLLFLDKTSFNLHTHSNYGYVLPSQPAHYMVLANWDKNISLVTIISTNKIEHFKLILGLFNTETFMKFLDEYNENNIFTPRNITIIDNLKVYHTQRVEDFSLIEIIQFNFSNLFTSIKFN